MYIQKFTFNYFSENTYILFDDTKQCVIIDPGCCNKNEELVLEQYIEQNKLVPQILLNTHCHIDHILGNYFVANKYSIELWINQLDLVVLEAGKEVAEKYFIPYLISPKPSKFIGVNDTIQFGNTHLEIRFTPGHSPGSICFIHHNSKSVIGGDVLFNRSIGRTDLPGGDFKTLEQSIQNQLYTLSDDYIVYSGHGEETRIGEEKIHNPFIRSNL